MVMIFVLCKKTFRQGSKPDVSQHRPRSGYQPLIFSKFNGYCAIKQMGAFGQLKSRKSLMNS